MRNATRAQRARGVFLAALEGFDEAGAYAICQECIARRQSSGNNTVIVEDERHRIVLFPEEGFEATDDDDDSCEDCGCCASDPIRKHVRVSQ